MLTAFGLNLKDVGPSPAKNKDATSTYDVCSMWSLSYLWVSILTAIPFFRREVPRIGLSVVFSVGFAQPVADVIGWASPVVCCRLTCALEKNPIEHNALIRWRDCRRPLFDEYL